MSKNDVEGLRSNIYFVEQYKRTDVCYLVMYNNTIFLMDNGLNVIYSLIVVKPYTFEEGKIYLVEDVIGWKRTY